MAPATVQALRRIAEETATSVKDAVFETTGFKLDADLRCELLGEALTSNLHLGNLNGIVARRTQLLVLYQCVNCNFDAVALHEAGCHNIIVRGSVPLPPYWKAWLSAAVIPQKAAALTLDLGAGGVAQIYNPLAKVRKNIICNSYECRLFFKMAPWRACSKAYIRGANGRGQGFRRIGLMTRLI